MRISPALVAKACEALEPLLSFSEPADERLSRFFRSHRELGQQDRAFIAETAFAVLRRLRSLEAAAGSRAPRLLVLAALVKLQGLSGRALQGIAAPGEEDILAALRGQRANDLPAAVRADLPDWIWGRLAAQQGEADAMRRAQGLLNSAPLDLRANLARITREAVLDALRNDGIEGEPTRFSPAGIRLKGKPAINRHPLFLNGLIEVQDEGSQLLAWLVAPRRGEMIADYCAGAGGKTLAMAMLMRGTGRLYAMDVSAKRLAALSPRAARAGITNVHPIVLAGERDARAKRLAGKMDRVLVDAPCSGFGTLRRNPDLKWRHGPDAISELSLKQAAILDAAAALAKRGGRLVYATCSILREENEAVAVQFSERHPEFRPVACSELLAAQRIDVDTGEYLRLWPDLHGTDGFFAAVFERIG